MSLRPRPTVRADRYCRPRMLPTFLGIGAPKSGSTWLYHLLAAHPDVVVSRYRKEVHYFDRHFEKGPGWYTQFFVAASGAHPAAVGEFTTHYLYDPAVPERIRSTPSVQRFLLIVRNPVDRAFSHYRFRRRQDRLTISFDEFLDAEPAALALGRYGENVSRWLEVFDREQFLILVYEDAVRDEESTRRRLAEHLEIDPRRFGKAISAANEAFMPKRPRLYTTAVRTARSLRRHELDRVIGLARRTGVVDVLKRARVAPSETLPPDRRAELWARFEADVARFAESTGTDVGAWRGQ
jgi:hypothetical protein